MSKQPSTPRRSVALAATFLVFAIAAFGAAFYLLDGQSILAPVLQQARELAFGVAPSAEPVPSRTNPSPKPDKLLLPKGMPEDFALRLWQEQLDSQPMIERLVNGEVRSLRIDQVTKKGDEAVLQSTVVFTDGVTAPGEIGLRRFGDTWYVASATAKRSGAAVKRVESPLPSMEDVDVALLNTILVENRKSRSVVDEYVSGIVKEVAIESISRGPQTITMELEMDETHGDGYANLVAIRHDGGTRPTWFLARFVKTGDES